MTVKDANNKVMIVCLVVAPKENKVMYDYIIAKAKENPTMTVRMNKTTTAYFADGHKG